MEPVGRDGTPGYLLSGRRQVMFDCIDSDKNTASTVSLLGEKKRKWYGYYRVENGAGDAASNQQHKR